MNSLIITTISLIAAGLITGSILFWTLRLGIGPTPTSRRVRTAIRDVLPDDVPGDIVELGCGWGHLIPTLREKYPDGKIKVWERSPIPALFTQTCYGIDVKRADFFQADLGNAGLIVCYLYPGAMERVEQELLPQLPTGCWLITHTFSLSGRKPVQAIKADDLYKTPIYLYQVG
ncbi:hypothetical protein [Endozoicomonas sp. SCSIO W0465]|uniref:hypothetical protein n=1 Tax=Endozoicomonas sp. SCSIO W0465 TaxID=2918516 RepID=UPI0020763DF8|nr:hypothetical protein [Endozoicomonas sp. SCSIO W0465]USE39321.1 hypothetical protein MJO57_14845 [Endozoicomonas sp. SCSIO W0465]